MKSIQDAQENIKKLFKDNQSITIVSNDNIKEFELWRDSVIKNSNKLCLKIQDDELDLFYEESDIKKVPRCLVQMTKQICHCDLDCIYNSLMSFKFDSECMLYDINDIFISIRHIDCDMFNKRIINGVLSDIKNEFDNAIFGEIFVNLEDLCDNKSKSSEKLQCLMYELKESCKRSNICDDFKLSDGFKQNCLNQNFKSQIDDIERSVNISNTDYTGHDFIRGIRSIRDNKNINEFEYDYHVLKNNQRNINSTGVTFKKITIAPFIALFVCIFYYIHNSKLKTSSTIILGIIFIMCMISCFN